MTVLAQLLSLGSDWGEGSGGLLAVDMECCHLMSILLLLSGPGIKCFSAASVPSESQIPEQPCHGDELSMSPPVTLGMGTGISVPQGCLFEARL